MRPLALVVLAACSFTVPALPASYRPRAGGPPPPCESTFVGRALLDVGGIVGTGSMAALSYAFSVFDCGSEEPCKPKLTAAVPWIALGVIQVVAIAVGDARTSACERAEKEYERLQPHTARSAPVPAFAER